MFHPHCVYNHDSFDAGGPSRRSHRQVTFLPSRQISCSIQVCMEVLENPNFQSQLCKITPQSIINTKSTLHTALRNCPHHVDRGLEMGFSVVPYSLNSLIENPLFTLSVDPYYHLSDKQCSCMVDTCNGLILLAGGDSQFGYFRLWNPTTMETSPNFGYFHRFRSPFPDHPFRFLGCYNFNFGCDISTGTYKIVASCYYHRQLTSDVRILSLGDNVWREIQSFPVVPLHFYFGGKKDENEKEVSGGVYLSSTLNWLAIHNHFDYNWKNVTVEQFVIVSLDLGTETYSEYRLPHDFDEVPPTAPIVSVLGGFLCCSYFYKETDFLIWQFEGIRG